MLHKYSTTVNTSECSSYYLTLITPTIDRAYIKKCMLPTKSCQRLQEVNDPGETPSVESLFTSYLCHYAEIGCNLARECL